ncbi:MAG: hypothetical protein AAGJ87_15130 [Pseudomonadota bacterium]
MADGFDKAKPAARDASPSRKSVAKEAAEALFKPKDDAPAHDPETGEVTE